MASNNLNVPYYEVDLTGELPENKIIERHTLTFANDKDFNIVIPRHAPFYNQSVIIKKLDTQEILVYGKDYYIGGTFEGITKYTKHQQIVGSTIIFLNMKTGGNYEITYQTLGGDYVLDEGELIAGLKNALVNPFMINFEDLINRPIVYPPTPHEHSTHQVHDYGDLILNFSRLNDTIAEWINREYEETPSYNQLIVRVVEQSRLLNELSNRVTRVSDALSATTEGKLSDLAETVRTQLADQQTLIERLKEQIRSDLNSNIAAIRAEKEQSIRTLKAEVDKNKADGNNALNETKKLLSDNLANTSTELRNLINANEQRRSQEDAKIRGELEKEVDALKLLLNKAKEDLTKSVDTKLTSYIKKAGDRVPADAVHSFQNLEAKSIKAVNDGSDMRFYISTRNSTIGPMGSFSFWIKQPATWLSAEELQRLGENYQDYKSALDISHKGVYIPTGNLMLTKANSRLSWSSNDYLTFDDSTNQFIFVSDREDNSLSTDAIANANNSRILAGDFITSRDVLRADAEGYYFDKDRNKVYGMHRYGRSLSNAVMHADSGIMSMMDTTTLKAGKDAMGIGTKWNYSNEAFDSLKYSGLRYWGNNGGHATMGIFFTPSYRSRVVPETKTEEAPHRNARSIEFSVPAGSSTDPNVVTSWDLFIGGYDYNGVYRGKKRILTEVDGSAIKQTTDSHGARLNAIEPITNKFSGSVKSIKLYEKIDITTTPYGLNNQELLNNNFGWYVFNYPIRNVSSTYRDDVKNRFIGLPDAFTRTGAIHSHNEDMWLFNLGGGGQQFQILGTARNGVWIRQGDRNYGGTDRNSYQDHVTRNKVHEFYNPWELVLTSHSSADGVKVVHGSKNITLFGKEVTYAYTNIFHVDGRMTQAIRLYNFTGDDVKNSVNKNGFISISIPWAHEFYKYNPLDINVTTEGRSENIYGAIVPSMVIPRIDHLKRSRTTATLRIFFNDRIYTQYGGNSPIDLLIVASGLYDNRQFGLGQIPGDNGGIQLPEGGIMPSDW